MVKSSLANSLQTCLGQRWTHDDFSDFTIVVEDMEFECHRFLLASCSGFFSLLLRSDMKENLEKKVILKNFTKETISVILNCIYKGEDGLTLDNILDVWHATHMLDIKYLFEECEQFILNNIDSLNYHQFFHHAKFLGSYAIISNTKKSILQYFEHFKTTQTFFDLSFEELHDLIKDTNLNVSSENVVIDAILEWVNGYPKDKDETTRNMATPTVLNDTNEFPEYKSDTDSSFVDDEVSDLLLESQLNVLDERKGKLAILLASSRLCVASEDYLEDLLFHPLLTSDRNAFRLVKEALLCHWKRQHHVSSLVSYRKCQDMCNVMAFVSDGNIFFYLLDEKRSCKMLHKSAGYTHLAAVNSDLFLCYSKFEKCSSSKNKSNCVQYEYFDVTTKSVKTLAKIINSSGSFFLCNQYFIFVSDCPISEKVIHIQNFNQNLIFLTIQTEPHAKAAFIHNECIFVSHDAHPDTELRVYSLQKQALVCIKKLPGPAENIVSFVDRGRTYLLQKNGHLWLVEYTGKREFDFKMVARLWNFFWNMYGAVCYNDELFLFGEFLTESGKKEFAPLPGLCDNIVVVEHDYYTQAVPMVVPRSTITQHQIYPA
ncbi:kelch-like protein 31 isoform X2 [Biomphalaria pfeifferi]|uniref:Kelch-like protein 31 isoform X2 n=1 Tax=Biomphalaria pfeifferi TaxID=112525 RepID=A0AAD8AWU1_BIOPF|nr:kelch-like protein 31 isoform X2 [Biomphalaria pfeifferi]